MAEPFCAWLLRPYLDLGAFSHGPLHAQRVEECWHSLADAGAPYFVAQRSLAPGFRTDLVRESARAEYAVSDPRQLPGALRTDRWRELCTACDRWSELPPGRRSRLIAVLHALCLYECVLDLVPPPDGPIDDPHEAELAFWRAFAQYMLSLPQPGTRPADLSTFEHLALDAGQHGPARFNSAIRVFVEKAKTGGPQGDLEVWGRHLERSLTDTLAGLGEFDAHLLKSRFYRAIGFIPQRQGDRAQTVRTMERAEQHALALKPSTPREQLLCLENLHALMESRTKEAIWLGDLDLALLRSLRVTEVDPFDSKAWAEVGEVRMKRREWSEAAEAYAVAAILGPPASAIARHMAGLCLRRLGQPILGALLFKDALEIDPLSISAREALAEMPDPALRAVLGEWMAHTVEL